MSLSAAPSGATRPQQPGHLLVPRSEALKAGAAASKRKRQSRPIRYQQWDSGKKLKRGSLKGVAVRDGRLHFQRSIDVRTKSGRRYEQATWISPWTGGQNFDELIASWSARTPGDSWIEVRVRGRSAAGSTSSWDILGQWTSGDRHLKRTSRGTQADDLGRVNVDIWQTSTLLKQYQLKVNLFRRAGSTPPVKVDAIGAVVSKLPEALPATSTPGPGRGIVLKVPRYSQMIHRGNYPQYGGGGQAWCSPTATSMVLGYYDALPGEGAMSWIPQQYPARVVAHAARMTFDQSYDGTGNWPFNTAYAAPLAGKAFVTRMRSLADTERFILAGIPVVTSISFATGELSGAPISGTNGHLVVVVGFTKSGDVVVNDPAASSASGVRRTYDRGQFERVWLRRSGGLAYVIRDKQTPLPRGNYSNW